MDSRPRESHLLVRIAQAALLVLFPAMVGISLALIADRTTPSLVLLVAEPLVWTALLAGTLALLTSRRVGRGLACLLGLGVLALAVRVPLGPPRPARGSDAVSDALRRCAADLRPPTAPVTLATWNTQDARFEPELLRSLQADVILLQGVTSRHSATSLASTIGAELLYTGSQVGVAMLTTRGDFGQCRGSDAKFSSFDLPSLNERRGRAVHAVVRLSSGDVPVLAIHADRPRRALEIHQWPVLLDQGGAELARLVVSLGSPGLIVAGDTGSHGTFRHFLNQVAGAPLTAAPARPTWPASLFSLPWLPLYHFDRVWYGPAWSLSSIRTQRMPSRSRHLALVAELSPRATHKDGRQGVVED